MAIHTRGYVASAALSLTCGSVTPAALPAGHYEIVPTLTTPAGVHVDPSGQDVDLKVVDAVVDAVESCLLEAFPSDVPTEVQRAGACIHSLYVPFVRSSITLKIPNDWLWDCTHTGQLLPWVAPQSGCTAKGLTPDTSCPCRWRAGQQGGAIVATPDLYMFPDWLIRVNAGCKNPWGHAALARCAEPVTVAGSNPAELL